MIRFRRKNFGLVQNVVSKVGKGASKSVMAVKHGLGYVSAGVRGIPYGSPGKSIRLYRVVSKGNLKNQAQVGKRAANNIANTVEQRLTTGFRGAKDTAVDVLKVSKGKARGIYDDFKDLVKSGYYDTGKVVSNTVQDLIKSPLKTVAGVYERMIGRKGIVEEVTEGTIKQRAANVIGEIAPSIPTPTLENAGAIADNAIFTTIPGAKRLQRKVLNSYGDSNAKRIVEDLSIDKGVRAIGNAAATIHPNSSVPPSIMYYR
jgi:hypothetical protein